MVERSGAGRGRYQEGRSAGSEYDSLRHVLCRNRVTGPGKHWPGTAQPPRGATPLLCGASLGTEQLTAQAARHVQGLGPDVRLAIAATGFLHVDGFAPEKSWRELDAAHMARAFAATAAGPPLLMKHFPPSPPRQGRSVFPTLSARVGSFGDNRLGDWYSYRASPAALNQFVHTAGIELRRRRPATLYLALYPGKVATPLSALFVKAGLDVQTTEQAADHLLDTVERRSLDSSGEPFDHRKGCRGDNSDEPRLVPDPAPCDCEDEVLSRDSRRFYPSRHCSELGGLMCWPDCPRDEPRYSFDEDDIGGLPCGGGDNAGHGCGLAERVR